jgi:cytochrome oxidase Cu insertion factor (SCO1/SenC/PrrC family)
MSVPDRHTDTTRREGDAVAPGQRRRRLTRRIALALGLAIAAAALAGWKLGSQSPASTRVARAVGAGAGIPIPGATNAPNFTLTDQFGHRLTLASLHGREVLLAFIDSRCTTVCPLTAAILHRAVEELGPRAKNVQIVAVNADPAATRVSDVYRFSADTGMLGTWRFVTGSPTALKAVYRHYQVYVCVKHDGQVIHTAAMYVIDPSGHERLYLESIDSRASSTMASETAAVTQGLREFLPTRPS